MSRDWTPDELQAASAAMKAAGHMSYEEFCEEFNEWGAKEALKRFARVQRKAHFACPRCGRMTMNDDPIRNALSRYADVQICDECGTDEAMRVYTGQPMKLTEWSLIKAFKEEDA